MTPASQDDSGDIARTASFYLEAQVRQKIRLMLDQEHQEHLKNPERSSLVCERQWLKGQFAEFGAAKKSSFVLVRAEFAESRSSG